MSLSEVMAWTKGGGGMAVVSMSKAELARVGVLGEVIMIREGRVGCGHQHPLSAQSCPDRCRSSSPVLRGVPGKEGARPAGLPGLLRKPHSILEIG
jgi:hypothetical protein